MARINWFLAFIVIWFTTLPSLDKPVTITGRYGVEGKLHPSRGTLASTTCIDGQWYIRTGRGFKKCSPWLGELRQEHARRQRNVAIGKRAVAAGVLVVALFGLALVSSRVTT